MAVMDYVSPYITRYRPTIIEYVFSYITLSNARHFTRQEEIVGSQQSAHVSS